MNFGTDHRQRQTVKADAGLGPVLREVMAESRFVVPFDAAHDGMIGLGQTSLACSARTCEGPVIGAT